MNIVRRKGEGGELREASLFCCEHTYPVRLNQNRVEEEEDGRRERREDGWVKGREDRMKKERGGQIRLRQSEQVYKGKNMMYNSTCMVCL